jgi:dsRNA-specific ribonuclease
VYNANQMKNVEKILNYSFSQKSLLVESLTHNSYFLKRTDQKGKIQDYERLEFLGDSVLNFLITRFFFASDTRSKVKYVENELH